MQLYQLPFPRNRGISHIKEIELSEDLFVDQWIVPKGTKIKVATGHDFGYCVLPPNTQDKRGFTIPRRIFRY